MPKSLGDFTRRNIIEKSSAERLGSLAVMRSIGSAGRLPFISFKNGGLYSETISVQDLLGMEGGQSIDDLELEIEKTVKLGPGAKFGHDIFINRRGFECKSTDSVKEIKFRPDSFIEMADLLSAGLKANDRSNDLRAKIEVFRNASGKGKEDTLGEITDILSRVLDDSARVVNDEPMLLYTPCKYGVDGLDNGAMGLCVFSRQALCKIFLETVQERSATQAQGDYIATLAQWACDALDIRRGTGSWDTGKMISTMGDKKGSEKYFNVNIEGLRSKLHSEIIPKQANLEDGEELLVREPLTLHHSLRSLEQGVKEWNIDSGISILGTLNRAKRQDPEMPQYALKRVADRARKKMRRKMGLTGIKKYRTELDKTLKVLDSKSLDYGPSVSLEVRALRENIQALDSLPLANASQLFSDEEFIRHIGSFHALYERCGQIYQRLQRIIETPDIDTILGQPARDLISPALASTPKPPEPPEADAIGELLYEILGYSPDLQYALRSQHSYSNYPNEDELAVLDSICRCSRENLRHHGSDYERGIKPALLVFEALGDERGYHQTMRLNLTMKKIWMNMNGPSEMPPLPLISGSSQLAEGLRVADFVNQTGLDDPAFAPSSAGLVVSHQEGAALEDRLQRLAAGEPLGRADFADLRRLYTGMARDAWFRQQVLTGEQPDILGLCHCEDYLRNQAEISELRIPVLSNKNLSHRARFINQAMGQMKLRGYRDLSPIFINGKGDTLIQRYARQLRRSPEREPGAELHSEVNLLLERSIAKASAGSMGAAELNEFAAKTAKDLRQLAETAVSAPSHDMLKAGTISDRQKGGTAADRPRSLSTAPPPTLSSLDERPMNIKSLYDEGLTELNKASEISDRAERPAISGYRDRGR